MSEIHIFKSDSHENGYFIGNKFVFSSNWSLFKYNCTEAEIEAFEAKVPTKKLKYLEWCQAFKFSSTGEVYKVGAIEKGKRISCYIKNQSKEKALYIDSQTLVIPLAKLFGD
ncbi:hypothetical protein JJL45_09085 [Tamlana sp. s12]|uniref:hypothetical protein n=1 Tax=Tamlana sp. s12 TaxID=1630406 RepID=UPI0007FD85C0|nr:hypothetical protein [Tamlana sp. s12]OBQ52890.1 hypothetical protein VQ01_13155 [Tamlana sp. s12]QQY81083.1 hypothetical protein JJL45_09085 [Tamlana sp. s12]